MKCVKIMAIIWIKYSCFNLETNILLKEINKKKQNQQNKKI